MAGAVQRLDRRALVNHPLIIEQQQAPRLAQREALAGRTLRFEHPGLTALDALPLDQEHRHQVDTVAVRTFRRGSPDATLGVDAELVRFDEPGLLPLECRSDPTQRPQERLPGRCADNRRLDRLEPALHAAMQRVVFDRLPVRSMRHLPDVGPLHHEAGVAAAPVVATVSQVVIRRQVVPAAAQGQQVFQPAVGQFADALRIEHRAALPAHPGAQLVDRDQVRMRRHDASLAQPRGRESVDCTGSPAPVVPLPRRRVPRVRP
jgi:hypothetical protein